jgi:hypothetical protein
LHRLRHRAAAQYAERRQGGVFALLAAGDEHRQSECDYRQIERHKGRI